MIGPDGRIRYYAQQEGLPDDRIWEVESDAAGRLWVATSDGLGCLQDGMWRTIGCESGLPSDRLWPLHSFGDTLLVGSTAAGWTGLDVRTLQRPAPRIEIHPSVM